MCRPCCGCWATESEAFSILGEGSHHEIYSHLFVPTVPGAAFPFETRWWQERKALWQPNTAAFYRFEDLPTAKIFEVAQEQLERDMGTPDRLIQWVLAGARLYGIGELDEKKPRNILVRLSLYLIGFAPTLLNAASLVLEPHARSWLQEPQPPRKQFDKWAKLFSEQRNRIGLWKN